MRWCISNCIMLTCLVSSFATEDTNNSARPKRDIALLKKLFKSILIGSHHVLNKIAPSPEPTSNHKGNIKVYQVPGYPNAYITEECDGKQRKLYLHPSLDVLESYLGKQEETLKALEGVKNLFESGILSHHKHQRIEDLPRINSYPYHPFYINYPSEEDLYRSHFLSGHKPKKVQIPAKNRKVENSSKLEIINHPVQQGFKEKSQSDGISLKPADLHRPFDSHPFNPFYMYPETEELYLSELLFGSHHAEKVEIVAKEPGEFPLHIGGIKEKEYETYERNTENVDVGTESPIPKPPTFDDLSPIGPNIGVELIEEIQPVVPLESPVLTPQPVVFDNELVEVIPEAPIIPTPQVIHSIDTEIEDFQPHVHNIPNKYSYNQINQDGSLTKFHNHGNAPDVLVTNQPQPLPSYIFNRFQWICSKFGVNIAHSRPVSNDIPVIINPVIVHSHDDRPIFNTPLNPTYQVPLNSAIHRKHLHRFPYNNSNGNFRSDEVHVKLTNRKPEIFNSDHKLPVNPITGSSTVFQNQDIVTESPIPKPPTFDDLSPIGSNVGVEVIKEIQPDASPEGPVLTPQPFVFDHKPIEVIPEAPILPTPQVIFPMPPTHVHTIIDSEVEKYQPQPPFVIQPITNKYSYNQINQDGSLTKTHKHDDNPDVLVTNQPQPLPSYIFNRFQWICSKFGVNIAHTRPVSKDIPVIINPVIVHSHNDRPIFKSPLNPTYQVPLNSAIRHQHPYYNLRPNDVHDKISNRKPGRINNLLFPTLPVNPILSDPKTIPEPPLFLLNGIEKVAASAHSIKKPEPYRYSFRILNGEADTKYTETLTHPDNGSFITGRMHQVNMSDPKNPSPKVSSGYSFKLVNGEGNIYNSDVSSETSLDEEEDVKLDVRKDLAGRNQLNSAIKNGGPQVSVTGTRYPNHISDKINQANTSVESIKIPKQSTGYSLSLANGKGTITYESDTVNVGPQKNIGSLTETKQQEPGKSVPSSLYTSHIEKNVKTQNLHIKPVGKADFTQISDIIGIGNNDSFGKKTDSIDQNPSPFLPLTSDKVDVLYIPSAKAQEETPSPASIENKTIKVSTPTLNAKRVIFDEPVSSRYIYKQLSDTNPNFTVVKVENPPQGTFKINSNVYVNTFPVTERNEKSLPNASVQVNPHPRFWYNGKSNQNKHEPSVGYFLNNPIVVPDEKVNYSYEQHIADGSNLTVHGNKNNKVLISVKRGDIPDY